MSPIRAATVDDAAAIAAVHVASWRSAYRDLLPSSMLESHTVARRTVAWHEILSAGVDRTIVATAEVTQQVIGFAAVGTSRDDDCGGSVGELLAIYLHPNAWSTGVGAQLHAAALADLVSSFSGATLWVLVGNQRARSFYERHGWHEDGATKDDVRGDVVLSEIRYRHALDLETMR